MKEFDKSMHMSCPECDFQVLHLNHDDNTVSFVFKNGTIDLESEEIDFDDITQAEHNSIQCNNKSCNWTLQKNSYAWKNELKEAMSIISKAMDDKNMDDKTYNKLTEVCSELEYIIDEE